jgi:LacI family transcriptional regulator
MGYSVNTISRALRDKDDIAPDTAKEIKKIATKMGYINNAAAVSLRLGYTNMIAVILGDISNPHFSIMMKEIENRARVDGYDSFLMNTNEDPEMEREAIHAALNKNVDGIIICPSQHDDSNIRYLIDTGIPFVQIGRHFDLPGASYVICNDELGGYQATKYLLDKGHRDIVMLNGPSYISSAKERQDGYRRALKEYGVKYRQRLVRESSLTDCSEAIEKMLREKLKFTALFAFSDMLAWGAWTFLRKFGLVVPDDCSIVGFDNIQSRFSIPFRLTTIRSYKAKMSTSAVEYLLSPMRNKKPVTEITELIIDTELVEGETVKSL